MLLQRQQHTQYQLLSERYIRMYHSTTLFPQTGYAFYKPMQMSSYSKTAVHCRYPQSVTKFIPKFQVPTNAKSLPRLQNPEHL